MSKISKTTLGELIEFQRGYDLPKSQFVEGMYPVQSSNGILGYHNEYKVKAPGITIGRRGTVGLPHLIKTDFFPHNTALFIKDFKGNNVDYIFYLLKNLKLGDKKSGSGVPTMNRNHLHPLNIKAHLDLQTQQCIAKVLSDLDAKIELNNKINQELEAMAKTLYDYWFVQFDFPNENGKPYKSSGGKMVYHEELKREIPEGWEVGTLGKNIEIERGISYKSSEINGEGVPMINLNSFNLNGSYKVEGIKQFSGSFNKKKVVKKGDLLIAVTDVTRNADIVGKAIIIPDIFKDEILMSMDVARISPNDKLDISFLNMLFNSQPYHDFVKQFASGTLVLHLDMRCFNFFRLAIPPKEILNKFYKLKDDIELKKGNIIKQNQELTALRDWLLPMLMNGQVTVGQAHGSAVGEVDEKLNSSTELSQSMAAEPQGEYGKYKSLPKLQEKEERHFLKRKVLASYIINQSLEDKQFGDVKFEKLLHLADYFAIQRNFGQNYYKKPAGPYDNGFTYPFFKQTLKAKWFRKESYGNLHRITAGVNNEKSVNTYDLFSSDELERVNTLIGYFKNSNYESPEIISTLYAVWNNRIIRNQEITDELLKQDFLEWDEQKLKYKNRIDRALNWMRENEIIPNGWGKYIDRKKNK